MNRKFGVEIEGINLTTAEAAAAIQNAGVPCNEESYNHTTRQAWKVVSDSSLRDRDGLGSGSYPVKGKTFEVVSPVLEGEAGLEEVAKVCAALQAAGASANKTCGLHVHIDGAGLTGKQVKNILVRYARHEAEIDSWMPTSRRGSENIYCKSVNHSGILSRISGETPQQLAYSQRDRYYKVNLQSWLRHGTVEFRQHSGTVEAAKIINWVRFLQGFVQASMETFESQEAEVTVKGKGLKPSIVRLFTENKNRVFTLAEVMAAIPGYEEARVKGEIKAVGHPKWALKCGQIHIEKVGYNSWTWKGQTTQVSNQTVFAMVPESVAAYLNSRRVALAVPAPVAVAA